jgi:hypothetical protein
VPQGRGGFNSDFEGCLFFGLNPMLARLPSG